MLVISADSQRQSIMGVSLDEEMSNMMKYQFGYSASARIMNILDEMIETVVNRMGITGR
jgi:flagellar hook-associated protein 1 FlgK